MYNGDILIQTHVIKWRHLKHEADEKRSLTQDEIDLVLSELPKHELKYRAAVLIAVMWSTQTGSRWIEMVRY